LFEGIVRTMNAREEKVDKDVTGKIPVKDSRQAKRKQDTSTSRDLEYYLHLTNFEKNLSRIFNR
jgi:hypothetical protein